MFYVDENTFKPLMLYFLGYDRLFGSHYDEYVIQYSAFTLDISDSTIFSIPDGKCVMLVYCLDVIFYRYDLYTISWTWNK